LKISFLQIWAHKTNANVHLIILEQVNEKYKVKISGPQKNMHLIEIVSAGYIKLHYKYVHTIKEIKKTKKPGRKKK
jgi:hypothetical protein